MIIYNNITDLIKHKQKKNDIKFLARKHQQMKISFNGFVMDLIATLDEYHYGIKHFYEEPKMLKINLCSPSLKSGLK